MDLAMPHSFPAWLGLVFLLGLRHGLDADHLATIDGLTRYNLAARPRLARWTGTLFSLGHGLVVVAVSVLMGGLVGSLRIPGWFAELGVLTSIVFLALIGVLNLVQVLRTKRDAMVRPVALKGRLFAALTRTRRPLVIVLVGAFFALAFDTLSQAAAWSLAATAGGGWGAGIGLGLAFLAGMLCSDGLNSYWVAGLLARADARARRASRLMGLAVAGLSLGMAAYEAMTYFRPVPPGADDREWLPTLVLLAALPLVYLWIRRRGARETPSDG